MAAHQAPVSLAAPVVISRDWSYFSSGGDLTIGRRNKAGAGLEAGETVCCGFFYPHQAPLSMGFPKQEYWSGLPRPPPGDLPDTGIIERVGSVVVAPGL